MHSFAVFCLFAVSSVLASTAPPTQEETQRYEDLGWYTARYNLVSAYDLVLKNTDGGEVAVASFYPADRTITLKYGQEYRTVSDVELGYFANGGSEGLRRAWESAQASDADPLESIYATTRAFLNWLNPSIPKPTVLRPDGRRQVEITVRSHPRLAQQLMSFKQLIPQDWKPAGWFRLPTKIFRADLEYLEVTYEEDVFSFPIFATPVEKTRRVLKTGSRYLLGAEQLKNYRLDWQRVYSDNNATNRPLLKRADGKQYSAGVHQTWNPVRKLEPLYP